MTTSAIWIIHREAALRAALERLASPFGAVRALGPSSPEIREATPPDVVLLGVGPSQQLEAELEATHRLRERAPRAAWVLIGEPSDLRRAQTLFAGLGAHSLAFPPAPGALEELLTHPSAAPHVASLRERAERDRLAERFRLWFEGVEIPGILRSLDPALAELPVLVRGETGSGRALVARYVQCFSDPEGVPVVALHCAEIAGREALLRELAGVRAEAGSLRANGRIGVLVEQVDHMPLALQSLLADWIELSQVPSPLQPARVRWLATAGSGAAGSRPLLERLADALSPLILELPNLRQVPGRAVRFAESFTSRWAAAHGGPVRSLSPGARDLLETRPWPGNLRELEAALRRVLVLESDTTIQAGSFLRTRAAAAVAEPTPVADASGQHDAPNPARASPRAEPPSSLLHLASSIAHEVRNPLVSIRTFAELLEENYADPEFRERFASIVRADIRRIEDVVGRFQALAEHGSGAEHTASDDGPGPLDLSSLVTELLDRCRAEAAERQLLVVEELDREQPFVLAEAGPLQAALEGLIQRALSEVPDRGHVYLASQRNEAGLGGKPALRLLLRYQHRFSSTGSAAGVLARSDGSGHALSPPTHATEFSFAEAVVRAHAGAFTLDTTDPNETVVVIDLPATAL